MLKKVLNRTSHVFRIIALLFILVMLGFFIRQENRFQKALRNFGSGALTPEAQADVIDYGAPSGPGGPPPVSSPGGDSCESSC